MGHPKMDYLFASPHCLMRTVRAVTAYLHQLLRAQVIVAEIQVMPFHSLPTLTLHLLRHASREKTQMPPHHLQLSSDVEQTSRSKSQALLLKRKTKISLVNL